MPSPQSDSKKNSIPSKGTESVFVCEKAMARGMAEHWPEGERLARGKSFCAELVKEYWSQCWILNGKKGFDLSVPPLEQIALNSAEKILAAELGKQLVNFEQAEACYLIGTVYTVLLPPDIRTRLGAYYTPPCLVDRLLDQVESAGFDWKAGTVLDPACGGGAFLAPVALRMIAAMKETEPAFILASLARRLSGYEIDPFAAWVSQSLLEICLMSLAHRANKRVPKLVKEINSLDCALEPRFDLVVGNPPYGRVSLSKTERHNYSRSLYGHANLYGVFTDLGLRLTKDNGILAYVTPTSFLSGQYFKELRRLILEESEPLAFDFVADRAGVFDDALQETLLTVYKKSKKKKKLLCNASLLKPEGLKDLEVVNLGAVVLPPEGENVWLMPRQSHQRAMVARLTRMPLRLQDIGYSISTGPLVWNRHRKQLRQECGSQGIFPLIWAEAVRNGTFSFAYSRSHHLPFVEVNRDQNWLLTSQSCVLCQRTTSKEQGRRLVAALLPLGLISEYGGVVVENHLNMIIPDKNALVSPVTVAALLNSEAVDKAFRCISGSVAVSAYEINALPFPSIEQLLELEGLVLGRASLKTIEVTINEFYGL